MSHSGRSTFELNRNEKKHHQENYAYWQNEFGKYFEELYSQFGCGILKMVGLKK